jgi:uncharacterized damage-inducible protein DinB
MLAMTHDLVRHKWYADASLLAAIQRYITAAQDQQLRELLHHIILANRFWVTQILGKPFAHEEESHVPETLMQIVGLISGNPISGAGWLSQLTEAGLDRTFQTGFHSGQSFSVAQAMMQICMHSQGHRAQCATRLRSMGGVPACARFHLLAKRSPLTKLASPKLIQPLGNANNRVPYVVFGTWNQVTHICERERPSVFTKPVGLARITYAAFPLRKAAPRKLLSRAQYL